MKNTFKQDKGQAGLTILLSVVVMLFIIGLIITIFTLMGSEMKDATYTNTGATINNETLTTVENVVGENLAVAGYRNVICTLKQVTNATSGTLITTNYTQTNCNLKYLGSTNLNGFNNSNWNVTYSYLYDADNTATGVMNDTIVGVSETTDWFDIFIVITAMVVLILLTVIIITAIRSSGMIAGGSTQGANQVGTA